MVAVSEEISLAAYPFDFSGNEVTVFPGNVLQESISEDEVDTVIFKG